MPPGFWVLHACDNPPCVRNDDPGIYVIRGVARPRMGHLWLGTHDDNVADKVMKGRQDRSPKKTGEDVWSAKLTEDDVRAIRSEYESGGIYQKALAQKYGVNDSQISRIITRKLWASVK